MEAIERDWNTALALFGDSPETAYTFLKANQIAVYKALLQRPEIKNVMADVKKRMEESEGWLRRLQQIMTFIPVDGYALTREALLVRPFITFIREKLKRIDNRYFADILENVEKTFCGYLSDSASVYFQGKDNIDQKNETEDFFATYPVLARILTLRTLSTIHSITLFYRRLKADIGSLSPILNVKKELHDVDLVRSLASDIHSDNGDVLEVVFFDKTSVIYKPRNPQVDIFLNLFIEELNSCAGMQFLSKIGIVPRKQYFWQQVIGGERSALLEKNEALVYAGRFLAICNLLLLEDYHVDNVKAEGCKFLGIDNEFFFTPRLPNQFNRTVITDEVLNRNFFFSILNHRLIPDIFRLFHRDFPDKYGLLEIGSPLGTSEVLLLEKGFLEAYDLIVHHGAYIKRFLSDYRIASRVLMRPTAHYYEIIRFVCKSDYIKTHIDFFAFLISTLTASVAKDQISDYYLSRELNYLQKFQIPIFFIKPGAKILAFPYESSGMRRQVQFRNWRDRSFIGKQIELLKYMMRYGEGTFYLDVSNAKLTYQDYFNIAFRLADHLALLYDCMYRRNLVKSDISSDYLSFENGLLGVLWFLSMVDRRKKSTRILRVINLIIWSLFGQGKNRQIYFIFRKNKSLTQDWLIFLRFLTVEVKERWLLSVQQKLEEIVIFELENQASASQSAPADKRLISYRNSEVGKGIRIISMVSADLQHPYSNYGESDDTLATGNFGWINAILNSSQYLEHKLHLARELCDNVINLRRESGFRLNSRAIDPFVATGLSGIGIVLLALSDDSKYSIFPE